MSHDTYILQHTCLYIISIIIIIIVIIIVVVEVLVTGYDEGQTLALMPSHVPIYKTNRRYTTLF